ncbi:MAG TPA: CoA transferase [Dehalococcoidia bacterium]|nr:CoA transferase [Dehalococcoidia bacterium]
MTQQDSRAGSWALGGVRVLDLTEYVAGPFAGQMLADMGANVIKLEPPQGDQWRLSNMIAPDESRGFLSVNRGKRSIAVDLKTEAGREIARKLALQADVLLSSYRPGVSERLGMDYATLSALNPGLVYCHNTAFGSTGPYSSKAGFDLVAQAMTGIISFESFGKAGKPQGITAAAITDFCSGVFMAYAAACALVQRNVTGKGQEVETSLFASGIALQYRPLLSIDMFDKAPRDELLDRLQTASAEGRSREEAMAEGYARNGAPAIATNPYYNIYRTRDSHMVIACLNNRLRRASARLLGVDDVRVEADEWDSTLLGVDGEAKLNAQIGAVFATKTTEEWCALFDAKGIPCGPVRIGEELYEDPHVLAQNLIPELEHPILGKVRVAGSPIKMSAAETGAKTASPMLGQHTREVLREIGYTEQQIDELVASEVVRAGD